jgi:hypothetical protein
MFHSRLCLSPGPHGNLYSTFVPSLSPNQSHAWSSTSQSNLLHSSKLSKPVAKLDKSAEASQSPTGPPSSALNPSCSPSISTSIPSDPICPDHPLEIRSGSDPSPCSSNTPENPTVHSMEDILSELKPFLE